MFCKRCAYPLRGLRQDECPECGRPFDPDAPHTFLRAPRGQTARRWLLRTLIVVLPVALLIGGWRGYDYWRAQRVAAAEAALSQLNAEFEYEKRADGFQYDAPVSVAWPNWWDYRDFKNGAPAPPNVFTELVAHANELGPCSFTLRGARPDNNAIADLARFDDLRGLMCIDGSQEQVADLRALPTLEALVLSDMAVSNETLDGIASLTGLECLVLCDTTATDEDLRAFREKRPDVFLIAGKFRSYNIEPQAIELGGGSMLLLQIDGVSNGGVRAHCTDGPDAKVVWDVWSDAFHLGGNNKYSESGLARVAGDRLGIVVSGSYGTFVELRRLSDGKLIKRWRF